MENCRKSTNNQKINEIRKDLYEIESEKNLFNSKEIETNLTKLEKNLSEAKSIMIMMIWNIKE